MTFKLKVVGGPRDGEVIEYDHLGTTWSRSDVFDKNGNLIGYYHCDGHGETELKFVSIEQHRAWLADVECELNQLEIDPEWLEARVKELLDGQQG